MIYAHWSIARRGWRNEKRRADALLLVETERHAAERRYADNRRRFSQMLLACATETEACELMAHGIESQVAGSSVSVAQEWTMLRGPIVSLSAGG